MKNTGLKHKREEAELTQVAIAKKAHITPLCYQRYEAGERIPRADIAILIAEALKVKTYKEFKALFSAATPDSGQAQN